MATPKILLYEVELRAVRLKRNLSRPVVYTNDLNSAEFQFKVIDMDAGDLSTATATTLLYMRDGSFFQNPKEDVSLVGTTFSYTLKENEGNHAGIAKIQLIVTIGEAEYATQLYEFEIINGLETKVAQEVMIYDWTTLTRDARAYIDEFVADELLRDAEFDNNEFDRNSAFVSSQDARTLAFGTEQTNRGTAFTAEQNERTTAFDESESGRTTAETGRVTAEEGRVTAETGRTIAETDRATAETNRVTAESGRVTAESGRVTAESGRATTFAGYNARITGMEADVNADATNLVTNGDFSNGLTGFTMYGNVAVDTSVYRSSDRSIKIIANESSSYILSSITVPTGHKAYIAVYGYITSAATNNIGIRLYDKATSLNLFDTYFNATIINAWQKLSTIRTIANDGVSVYLGVNGVRTFNVNYDDLIVIDLTATFGKGNEPTAEQMDALLAKFPNSWFNGTASLFQSKQALTKQIALDARTEFEAKNGIVNGDFSNGITGWGASNSINTVTNNILTNTASGTLIVAIATQVTDIPAVQGNKLYVAAKVAAKSADCLRVNIGYNGTGNGGTSYVNSYQMVANPTINTKYQASNIFTVSTTAGNTGMLRIHLLHYYVDNETANGKAIEAQYVQAIDLTATFGAGKEPTLAEMDRLMARYPNSWFDGTKPIQTIETLYQEKANKVQEAWITPTLLNGWTVSDQAVGYYKDEFGVVRLKGLLNGGSIATAIFALPVGYRPKQTLSFPISANSAFGRIIITSSGNVSLNAGSTLLDYIDGITFRAEQ